MSIKRHLLLDPVKHSCWPVILFPQIKQSAESEANYARALLKS